MGYEGSITETTVPEWDLRQARVKLITLNLIKVDRAREFKQYPEWFRALRQLEVVAKNLWQGVNECKNANKNIRLLKERCTKIFNENRSTFFGDSKESIAVGLVEDALFHLEEKIHYYIKLSGGYGDKSNRFSL